MKEGNIWYDQNKSKTNTGRYISLGLNIVTSLRRASHSAGEKYKYIKGCEIFGVKLK